MKCSFCGASYKGRSAVIDTQECVNFYPETAQGNDEFPITLVGTPGLKFRAAFGAEGSNRNMFVSGTGRCFAVIGITLVELRTNFSSIVRGTLATNLGRVSFAEVITPNGSYVMIVDGKAGYIFDTATNLFSRITSPGYVPGTSVVSMNGFFIQNTLTSYFGGCRFIFSGQYAAANTWDPLDYFTGESDSSPIVALQTINAELWVMKSRVIEIWQYTGQLAQFFARISSGMINVGLAGPYAVATLTNNIFWLGSNPAGSRVIWQAGGFIPQQISTHAIEFILGQINTEDCVAFSYQQEGHFFVIFNFINGDRTLVYDTTTQLWHERSSYQSSTGIQAHHRAISVINWQDLIFVGDYAGNKFYQWDMQTHEDDGVPIIRHRTAPHIRVDRRRMFFREFEIDIERGGGKLPAAGTGPGTDITGPSAVSGQEPKAMMQWSDDGGVTWSNERWETAGPRGKYKQRIHWHKIGYGRDRVFRVTFSDPIQWIIVDARMDTEVADQ
jgi:hypothetical protein